MDIGMLGKGKSDPYALVTVGAQQFRTQIINNTVSPKWDYWCEVRPLFIYLQVLNSVPPFLCSVSHEKCAEPHVMKLITLVPASQS